MTRLFIPTLILLQAVAAYSSVRGEDTTTARKAILPTRVAESVLPLSLHPDAQQLPDTWQSHPLSRALTFAAERQAFIDNHVADFSCILAKRERIDGRLGDYEYLRTDVRRSRTDGEKVIPFSVYTEFLAPKRLVGRRVLYVDGQNDNKMMVRKGGSRFGHVIVNIGPTSDAAMRESRYPITELGLSNVVYRLVEQAKHDIVVDPEAANTEVEFFRNAEVDGRVCTHIRVTHPKKDETFEFHQANIYVDDKLNVPIRVETYTWGKDEGQPPLLLEEYTYMRLKLNSGLTDRDFSPTRVHGKQ